MLEKKSDAVQPFFKNAYGYAAFPTVGNGGLGVGGAYDKSQVHQGGKVTGEASIGGQKFSYKPKK